MRVVIQRVKHSSVTIDGQVVGKIDKGFLLLVGFKDGDKEEYLDKMVEKIINLRIFEDDNDKMNLSLLDVKGEILSVSQFTLYADCKRGRRPGFTGALVPNEATILYDKFNQILESKLGKIEKGIFGADMKIDLVNDGPVTIILDSDELF